MGLQRTRLIETQIPSFPLKKNNKCKNSEFRKSCGFNQRDRVSGTPKMDDFLSLPKVKKNQVDDSGELSPGVGWQAANECNQLTIIQVVKVNHGDGHYRTLPK